MNEVLERVAALSKPDEKVDFLNLVFGKHRQPAVSGTTSVVLFGAGAVGKDLCLLLHLHGVHPVCFCDNNPSQIGCSYFETPVISFDELLGKHKNSLIVIASFLFAAEIRQQLLERNFEADRILDVSSVKNLELLGYYQHCNWYTQNPKHALSWEDLVANQGTLLAAYNLLADQRSKDIFVGRHALFISPLDYTRFANYITRYSELNEKERGSFPFYVSPEDYGYFNNDVLEVEESDTLIDGGAFNGLSAATFAETCERKGVRYRKILCFEPDPCNSKVMQKNTAALRDVEYFCKGLWSHTTTLSFVSAKESDPAAHVEFCEKDGKVEERRLPETEEATGRRFKIQTIGIDDQFSGAPISFIKMDVEGAEMEALRGAADTIRRCRPKLAISAYHKHSDIYQMPLMLHELCPSYRFYLRHYSYTLFDMVLFAIPASV